MGRPRKQKADSGGKTQPKQAASKPRAPRRTSGAAGPPYDVTNTKTKTTVTKPPRMTKPGGVKKATGARRGPSRTSKKDPWREEQLTTSTNSPLIHLDLVKLLADPRAWTCLDEDEKKEIIALLPDDIQRYADPGPKSDGQEDTDTLVIPPLPESFVRYSNNWRDAVRQFQSDLEMGKYDPEWQRQAAEAMEERAQGKFDKFKEEQFEEFWGQKQKLDYDVIAGESSRVKLGALVENGVVRVGDVWRYSRSFGRGREKLLLEKEVQIVNRDGPTLTFAIPPGQRTFLCNTSDVAQKTSQKDIQAGAVNNAANGVNNCAPLAEQASQESQVDTEADPVTSSVLLAKTTSPRPDEIIPNGDANQTLDTPPMVPDNHHSSEPMEASGAVCTAPPVETLSPAATEQYPMNVKSFWGDNMLRGISDLLSVDSDSELSSVIDMSSPQYWSDDTKLPATSATDIGTTTAEPVAEALQMETTLDENHDRSSDSSSDVLVAANGSETTHSGAEAGVNDVHLKTPMEPLPPRSQSFASAAVNGSTTDATLSAGVPESPKHETTAESTGEITTDTAPQPISEQAQEPIPKDIIFSGVTGPGRLASKILEIDGRITEPPNGNAWKEFRCYRDNQDMGSLWECRQSWFVRNK
ncbi:hypothetical protein GX51_05666 [Blastomyces parvus]|uniref:DEUBAD domain-containing protein n=1 Tax=Blastomyces parvus TaxID=2060905 RepID=A0A2B7WVR9_9EURO|nr:hypothetical protein GX51_05666 [Blastomyces parvus]